MRLDDLPAAVVAPALDRRRLQRDPGGRRGVVRLRVGVFDPAGQAEHQRVRRREAAEPIAEVEDDPVLLGVADPALRF